MIVKPYILPLLPTFHGMESENPYTHIRDFDEVCNTFKEDATKLDLMRLNFFSSDSKGQDQNLAQLFEVEDHPELDRDAG